YRNPVLAGFRHDLVEAPAIQRRLIIAAVREKNQEIAGSVQEIKRLEQLDTFFDALNDSRAGIVESSPFFGCAHETDTEKNVLIVRRERRHDIRIVTESNERH